MSRALVISGGGCKGAFAIGAIEYLLERFNEWEIIVGTSTGALIAPLVAGGKFDLAKEIYSNVKTEDLIKQYCWLTLPWRSSIYNDKGLRKIIDKNYDERLHHYLRGSFGAPDVEVCTVNLNSGKICYWSPKDLSREEFCNALSASSNQPGFMPPRKIYWNDDEYYVDGGVREIIPIERAIELGASEITAIVLEPSGVCAVEGEFDRIPRIMLRSLRLMTVEIREDDIPKGVNLKIIRPDEPLTNNSLRFDPIEMREMMKRGYEAAKKS